MSVEENSAGPALTFTASESSADESKTITQDPQQGLVIWAVNGHTLAVDGQLTSRDHGCSIPSKRAAVAPVISRRSSSVSPATEFTRPSGSSSPMS